MYIIVFFNFSFSTYIIRVRVLDGIGYGVEESRLKSPTVGGVYVPRGNKRECVRVCVRV